MYSLSSGSSAKGVDVLPLLESVRFGDLAPGSLPPGISFRRFLLGFLTNGDGGVRAFFGFYCGFRC